MSTPLLITSEEKKGRFLSRLGQMSNLVQSRLAGKDDLTIAVEKAFNDTPGMPKKKHIEYIIQVISGGQVEQVEEVLLRCNAMCPWQDSVIVVMKIIQCLLLLTKHCYDKISRQLDVQVIFLQELRKVWTLKPASVIVDKVLLSLLHQIALMQDFPALAEVVLHHHVHSVTQFQEINRCNTYRMEELVNFITKSMSLHMDMLAALRVNLEVGSTALFTEDERVTIDCCKSLLHDEMFDLIYGVQNLLNYVQQVDQGEHVNVLMLKEQLDSQIAELRRLRDIKTSKDDLNRI